MSRIEPSTTTQETETEMPDKNNAAKMEYSEDDLLALVEIIQIFARRGRQLRQQSEAPAQINN